MVLFRKLILYIATSLDGYIAREDGNIDWLSIVEDKNEDYSYKEFVSSIDTIIMGRKTYDMVLSFDEFPYPDKKCFVITRKERNPDPRINFWNGDISEYIISVVPIILGSCISLFQRGVPEVRLGLLGSSVFHSGLVQLTYKRQV